ncbi:hypothetical protein ACVW16_000001, partial [Bradyrhizobium sp. USDA 4474]
MLASFARTNRRAAGCQHQYLLVLRLGRHL